MAICDVVSQRISGTFVCDNTIKDLTQTEVNGDEISYSLELQDGTKGTFTLNGNDIINLSFTDVPNDSTPINYIIKNIIEILNEQTNFTEISETANAIIIRYDVVEPIVVSLENLISISDYILIVSDLKSEVYAVGTDLEKGIGTNTSEDSAILNAFTNANNSKESETNAKNSENESKISELNSKESETNSKTSENNSKTSENNAKTSETNSLASENNSKISESNANTSEDNSKISENNSLTSENNAKVSETNAKTSENNSKASENNSSDSESNSLLYSNNAKTSETNAKTSEDNAKISETNASGSASRAETAADSIDTSVLEDEIATKIGAENYATSTVGGTVKARYDSDTDTLYITIDGTDA